MWMRSPWRPKKLSISTGPSPAAECPRGARGRRQGRAAGGGRGPVARGRAGQRPCGTPQGGVRVPPPAPRDALLTALGCERDFSAIAPPETLTDWRLVLAYEAAVEAGVLAALPGSLAELAARCDLDEGALRAVLGLLAAWGIVTTDEHGRYHDGPAAPVPPGSAILAQHGVWIRRWTALLGKRLRHRTAASDEAPARSPTEVGLDLLAVINRRWVT